MSDESKPALAPGDIVQITDEAHPWYPAVLVVGEVKAWGVQACVIVPESNDGTKPPVQMWNRLRTGSFAKVGAAEVVPG